MVQEARRECSRSSARAHDVTMASARHGRKRRSCTTRRSRTPTPRSNKPVHFSLSLFLSVMAWCDVLNLDGQVSCTRRRSRRTAMMPSRSTRATCTCSRRLGQRYRRRNSRSIVLVVRMRAHGVCSNHSLMVSQRNTAITYSVAACLSRVADAEWLRSTEDVRRFSPLVGPLGEWRTLCEAGWTGSLPGDLPDVNAPPERTQPRPAESVDRLYSTEPSDKDQGIFARSRESISCAHA